MNLNNIKKRTKRIKIELPFLSIGIKYYIKFYSSHNHLFIYSKNDYSFANLKYNMIFSVEVVFFSYFLINKTIKDISGKVDKKIPNIFKIKNKKYNHGVSGIVNNRICLISLLVVDILFETSFPDI